MLLSSFFFIGCYKKSWDCTSDVPVNNRDVTIKKKEEGIAAFLLFLLVAVKITQLSLQSVQPLLP